MKRLFQTALVMMVLGVMGCAEGQYPVSGKTCGPNDPVIKLDARDCTLTP